MVRAEELQELFVGLGLWQQIQDGTLTTHVAAAVPATNPRYGGGTSQMLIHRDHSGRHVCTTHRIVDRDGSVLHWDTADVHLPSETLVKRHETP
jgi:hypothetical protein